MADIVGKEIEAYVEMFSQDEPQLLSELKRETFLKVLQPNMLSGHFQGRLLSLISKMICPENILEIGTYTGYSALCLCEGLKNLGQLHTIDIKEELQGIQRRYFDRSDYGNQIVQHLGKALDIIPTFNIKFDLVFIDADKANYANYFNAIVPKMNRGGIILSDNVLWKGKVVDESQAEDVNTKLLNVYNKLLKEDPRVEVVILPIRDGLSVCRVV